MALTYPKTSPNWSNSAPPHAELDLFDDLGDLCSTSALVWFLCPARQTQAQNRSKDPCQMGEAHPFFLYSFPSGSTRPDPRKGKKMIKCFLCSKDLDGSIQCVFEYDNGEKFTAKVCRKCETTIRPTVQKGN